MHVLLEEMLCEFKILKIFLNSLIGTKKVKTGKLTLNPNPKFILHFISLSEDTGKKFICCENKIKTV